MYNSIICDYFKLPVKIEHAKKRYARYDWLFWQQSFISCPNAYDDNGNKIGLIPFQNKVDDLLSMEHEFNAHDESYFLQAKSFFYRISYLSSEEREQLAYIYYYPHPSDRPSSEDICKHFGFGSRAKVTDFKNKLLAKILKPVYKPFKQHQRDMDEI